MDPNKLVRDAARVKAALEETPDNRLIAKKQVKIYIPTRFQEKFLAEVGVDTYIVGIYGMVLEDTYYASACTNAMMQITPSSMLRVLIRGDEYFEFTFEAGSVISPSTLLVKTDSLVYRIYEEIFSKGRVPWYLGYVQLGHIFDTARKHAGANIGNNQEVTELIVSMIARDETDRTQYIRSKIRTMDDLIKHPPAFVGLRSVQYSATNTLNKLAGSYFHDGVVSALVNPATRQERLEKLLRA